MKRFVLVFVLVSIAAIASAGPSPDIKAFFDECKTELGLPDGKPPQPEDDDPKAKCFHACIMKKTAEMKDGKLVTENILEILSKLVPNADDAKKTAMTECINEANKKTDECEVAHAFGKCLHDKKLAPSHPPMH